MKSWRTAGVCVATAALAWLAPASAEARSVQKSAPETVELLDVPYVPQSGELCGGAALAMVLRYWGKSGVLAEDFAPLAEPGAGGIRTGALVRWVEAHGWSALRLPGAPAEVESHLARGRPVIALIRTGSGSYHYVVLVAWANGWVILHDPNVGPFRTVREGEFETAWSGSDDWALVVLPPPAPRVPARPDSGGVDLPPRVIPDGCGALVDAGVLLAREGDIAEAELKLVAAQSLCPDSASPLRERAGLRFRAEDWEGAGRLAEEALALDPGDAHSWRLLAGSRFLAGDVEGALTAWNHLSEPRIDLTHIDGLNRIRYSAVAGQLALPPGRLLTPQAFLQARRRLAELPSQSDFRLSLRPLPDGRAQVDVSVLERPPLFGGFWDAGNLGIRALLDREITFDVVSPTGNGELWSAGWRWQRQRPRVALDLAVPGAGGRPGIWHVAGFWERQTYAYPGFAGSGGAARSRSIQEERRRTALSISDWIGPNFRLEVGSALDEWVGRGSHLSLEGSVETRWARDRLALGARGARWISLADGAPFGAGGLSLTWCSDGLGRREGWQGGLEVSAATREAPLALWSGAGTGSGRTPLLRAHPAAERGGSGRAGVRAGARSRDDREAGVVA